MRMYLVTTVSTLLLLVHLVQASPSQPDVLDPTDVTDAAGNTANGDSNITWGPFPTGIPYKTSTDYDDGGLAPWFDFARSFINTVQPNEIPIEIITDAANGDLDLGARQSELINYMIGFGVCIGIGLLFVLIMPIVGICFCCCRLCGNCGGKMIQRPDEKRNCKRIVFSIVLLVLTIFMSVGVICTYVTNDRMTDTLNNYEETIDNNLDDMTSFLTNTVDELNHTGLTNFDFVIDVIDRDLDNIGYLIGVPVRTTLENEGGVGAALDAILDFDSVITQIHTDMHNLDDSVTAIQSDGSTLSSDLSDVKTDVDTALALPSCDPATCGAIDSTGLAMDVDFSTLPDISSELADIDAAKARNMTALVIEGSKEFTEIPERVQNETIDTVNNVKQLLADFRTEIVDQIQQVQDLPNDVNAEIANVQEDLKELTEPLPEYNEYRWNAGIGLACSILIIVVLQLIGILFGFCGFRRDSLPTDRSCLSHSGGNMLIAATAFIFIFSWLLMLLTTISFVVGGSLETLVCEPLTDPDRTILKEVLDGPGGLLADDGEYFLGKTILNNASIPLTLSGVLDDCKEDKAAYSALKLSSQFDLNSITDYRSSIDIQSEIDAINVDLSTVTILSTDMQDQLNDLKSAVAIDYNGFQTELSKDTTQTDLADFSAALRVASSASSNPAKNKLKKAADDLDDVIAGSYAVVVAGQSQLLSDVNDLESATSTVPTDVDDVLAAAGDAETYIQNNGSDLIKTEASNFADRVLGIADQFSADVTQKVENEVGRCLPVWNLWESLIEISICNYTVDTLNGFWFGLGWAIFFMVPSIIFNVKLAKHLRRMKWNDEMDKIQPTSSAMPGAPNNLYDQRGSPPPYASNKIAPA